MRRIFAAGVRTRCAGRGLAEAGRCVLPNTSASIDAEGSDGGSSADGVDSGDASGAGSVTESAGRDSTADDGRVAGASVSGALQGAPQLDSSSSRGAGGEMATAQGIPCDSEGSSQSLSREHGVAGDVRGRAFVAGREGKMQKANSRKLAASVALAAASVALLLGLTFAWFTDSVKNEGNTDPGGHARDRAFHHGRRRRDPRQRRAVGARLLREGRRPRVQHRQPVAEVRHLRRQPAERGRRQPLRRPGRVCGRRRRDEP